MSDIPMAPKGQAMPPRKKADEESFVSAAPLHTAGGDEPSVDVKPEVDTVEKPWRQHTNMSKDELCQLARKVSLNIPAELLLRIDFLLSQKKPNVFGPRPNRSEMIIESLEKYTKAELKKLGFDNLD
ncbi:hypothetical protein [Acinetobacter brisouii]|uniref:hypothetical protein n=1 Tax=Acinetobacter brisouii TaxID=396323 RepID=UPI00124E13E8|nr:hypothetical protein [Acinetobacter brisouii]